MFPIPIVLNIKAAENADIFMGKSLKINQTLRGGGRKYI